MPKQPKSSSRGNNRAVIGAAFLSFFILFFSTVAIAVQHPTSYAQQAVLSNDFFIGAGSASNPLLAVGTFVETTGWLTCHAGEGSTKTCVYDDDFLVGETITVKVDEEAFANTKCNNAFFVIEVYKDGAFQNAIRTPSFIVPKSFLYAGNRYLFTGITTMKASSVGQYALSDYIWCEDSDSKAKNSGLQVISSASRVEYAVRAVERDATGAIIGQTCTETATSKKYCADGNVVQNWRKTDCEQWLKLITDCSSNQLCNIDHCVDKPDNPVLCGNSAVDDGESCENCKQDMPLDACRDEPQGCPEGTIQKGNVCIKTVCPEGFAPDSGGTCRPIDDGNGGGITFGGIISVILIVIGAFGLMKVLRRR